MALPAPTLDHVVVNVRGRMDAAAATYERLGFTLTPRGFHTLGSHNHLAVFGTDYLELIGAPADADPAPENMAWPEGLNAVVFGTEDAAAVHDTLAAAGVPVLPPIDFSRPVRLPDGERDARFRVVRVAPAATPAGRLYFCQHATRELVWHDAWRRHANGVVGVARVVIAATDPQPLGALLGSLFGADQIRPAGGGARLMLGLTRVDVVPAAVARRRYGSALPPDDGRPAFMAALVLRTTDLGRTAAALRAGEVKGAHRHYDRIVVPAAEAFGVALDFRD